MSNLNINIDMDRVQSSVQAAIRPAVEAALAERDVQKIIQAALAQKKPKSDRHSFYAMMGYPEPDPGTLLEQLVRESIQTIAKQYVEKNIREQKADIEEAFRKMMQGSASRLTKAFADAVGRALKEDWGFELDVKVRHTVAEKDCDDD